MILANIIYGYIQIHLPLRAPEGFIVYRTRVPCQCSHSGSKYHQAKCVSNSSEDFQQPQKGEHLKPDLECPLGISHVIRRAPLSLCF